MITELGLDCGDVCMRLPIEIPDTMNCEDLFNEISDLSPKLLEETLVGLVSGTIKPVPQCEDGVCMANKLTKEEVCIDNYPENLQSTERFDNMENAVDNLNNALEKIDDVKEYIEAAIG